MQDIKRELSMNSIRCSVRRSTNNGLLYQADAVSVGLGCLHLLLSPLAPLPLSYRRHHCFRTHASARCTFVRSRLRARASALTQAHNARAYAHDYARACLAPDGQANFENSCVCFIRKPLRTPEMASFLAPGFPLVRNLIRLV